MEMYSEYRDEEMELFDVVDAKGIPTGEIIERSEAHEKDIPHRTAHVWVVRMKNGKPQVLLQKRAAGKESFPGAAMIRPQQDTYMPETSRWNLHFVSSKKNSE